MDILDAEPAAASENALAGPLTLPPVRVTEYPRAGHFIVHFSDTHLIAGDHLLYNKVDSDSHLAEALAELEDSGARPAAFIFTGDLADTGQPEAYAKLRQMVEPVARRMGAELIWLMGNHDDRATFRSTMLEHLPTTEPADAIYYLDGLRIIALDSTVPGHHYGEVTPAQLTWLARVLATPAMHGTILAMHHPPIPSVLDLAVAVELRDQGPLAAVLRGTDVRSILAGHLHYSSSATFAGIPVSVASATCYTQDLTVPVGGTRARDGAQAFNLVHVFEHTVIHSVVPVGRGPAMSFISAAESAALLAKDGIQVRA
jgi:Icc protein